MTPEETLVALRSAGVAARADGEHVCLSGPDGAITPELLEVVRANKPALLELLSNEPHLPAAALLSELHALAGDAPGVASECVRTSYIGGVRTHSDPALADPAELRPFASMFRAADTDELPTGRFELRPATEHDGPAEVTSLRAWVKELGRDYHAGRRGQALRDLAEVAEALRRHGWEPAGGNAP